MDKSSKLFFKLFLQNNFFCKQLFVSSVSFELYSPAGMYEVSNFSESEILKVHLSFNKAHNFSG
jgi:hypothetical protein